MKDFFQKTMNMSMMVLTIKNPIKKLISLYWFLFLQMEKTEWTKFTDLLEVTLSHFKQMILTELWNYDHLFPVSDRLHLIKDLITCDVFLIPLRLYFHELNELLGLEGPANMRDNLSLELFNSKVFTIHARLLFSH